MAFTNPSAYLKAERVWELDGRTRMRNLAAGHQGAYLNKVIAAYASFNPLVQ